VPCSRAPACAGGARPARLAVAADACRWDQRGVHQRPGAHRDALGDELPGDGLEQDPVQAARNRLAAEADKRGALGGGLVGGEAAEPAEAGAVVQRIGQPDIGEVVPSGQQQGPEQRQWRPTKLTLRRRRDARKGTVDLVPIEQCSKFRQR
jgi:hypothetical protein